LLSNYYEVSSLTPFLNPDHEGRELLGGWLSALKPLKAQGETMYTFQLFEIGPAGNFVIHKIQGLYPTFEAASSAAEQILATAAPFCGYRIREVRTKPAPKARSVRAAQVGG
jgi:hypothetical protein